MAPRRGSHSTENVMTKKPSEGKAPVTGRSGRQRVEDRRKTEAGAKVVAKRIQDAIELRGRVVLGDAAARYSSKLEPTRRLAGTALREIGERDVRRWLRTLSSGKRPLVTPSFDDVWRRWQRLRELDKAIEAAWADVELLLRNAPDGPDCGFDGAYDVVETLVDEWEAEMEIEHPLGQIMRITAR
jgi:hypothetical protein